MLDCIQKLLADGVSAISVNTYLRRFKAYLWWLQEEGHIQDGCKVNKYRRCPSLAMQTVLNTAESEAARIYMLSV